MLKFMTYTLKLIGIEVGEDEYEVAVQRRLHAVVQVRETAEERQIRREWTGR